MQSEREVDKSPFARFLLAPAAYGCTRWAALYEEKHLILNTTFLFCTGHAPFVRN